MSAKPAAGAKVDAAPQTSRKRRRHPDFDLTIWERQAKESLQIKMSACDVTYKELSRRLGEIGIDENPDQLNRKVNRGKFSAAFYLTCLAALGVTTIDVPRYRRAGQADVKT